MIFSAICLLSNILTLALCFIFWCFVTKIFYPMLFPGYPGPLLVEKKIKKFVNSMLPILTLQICTIYFCIIKIVKKYCI